VSGTLNATGTGKQRKDKTTVFDKARQESVQDMDITYAPEGLTLSGHMRMPAGAEGARIAREMAQRLEEAATHLEAMDEFPIVPPEPVSGKFGRSFDD